jgi:transposase
VIVVICDNDSIHHARAVTRYLQEHPRLEVLYGARYSPHDNPAERIWAALKNYVANTAVSWPGRLRQIPIPEVHGHRLFGRRQFRCPCR